MFFRIWFLYLSKIGLLGFVLAGVGLFADGRWGIASLLQMIGMWLVIPLGIAGALIALEMLIRPRLACPICGDSGEFVTYDKQPAVDCSQCGLVYCKNALLSCRLCVEPLGTFEADVETHKSR